jgi:FAD/FMN-containing dehydrogenase
MVTVFVHFWTAKHHLPKLYIRAIPLPRLTTVAWLPFATVEEAVAVVSRLVPLRAEAVELMVASTLTIAAKSYSGTPSYWKTLDPQAAALLVEFGASDEKRLDEIEEKVRQELYWSRQAGRWTGFSLPGIPKRAIFIAYLLSLV